MAGESVAAYIVDLCCVAQYCNLGTTLDKMLRDRLLWGMNETTFAGSNCKKKTRTLLSSVPCSLLSAETAHQSLRDMIATQKESSLSSAGVPGKTEAVHNIRSRRRFTPRAKEGDRTRHRYGAPGHLAPACRFKDNINFVKIARKRARVCRSKPPSHAGTASSA